MWPWQLKNVHERYILWAKLLATSFTMHSIVFFLFFFVYADRSNELKFVMNKSMHQKDASILLMEAYALPRAKFGSRIKSGAKIGFPTQKNGSQKKAEVAKKAVELAAKKVVVPVAKKPAIQTSIVTSKNVGPTKKAVAKKTVVSARKKELQKKNKKTVKPAVAKKVAKKIVEKKTQKTVKPAAAKKKVEKKPEKIVEEKKDQIAPKIKEPESFPANKEDRPKMAAALAPGLDYFFKSNSNALADNKKGMVDGGEEYNLEDILREIEMNQEISRCWVKPIGVGDDYCCTIKVRIDENGAMHDMKMVEASGILMYDIAARSSMCAIQWPQWAYNRFVIITF